MTTDAEGAWEWWRARRPGAAGTHLDTANAGRASEATLGAVAAHARLEAVHSVPAAAAAAGPVIESARRGLGSLFGVPAGGVAFVESGSAALHATLSVWPLKPGDEVAVAPGEWGPALSAYEQRGIRTTRLATDAGGVIDLDALERLLAKRPPAAVHLTAVATHRSLAQPCREAAELCRAAGVPLWVDAAQALGHVDCDVNADVQYAPGRKWLAGPRGVAVVAFAQRRWGELKVQPPAQVLAAAPANATPVRLMESIEGHIAGRVGLANAVSEHLDAGPSAVARRLSIVGEMTRQVLEGATGWEVVSAAGPSTAINGLRPMAGQDVAAVQARLQNEHEIYTTAALPWRAPLEEMDGPTLRLSPHVDCTERDLQRLRNALQGT